jgi:hypothetical protein
VHFKAQMEAAGFVNVTETIYKWPSNRWPKEKKFKELGTSNSEALGFLGGSYRKTNSVSKGCGRIRI